MRPLEGVKDLRNRRMLSQQELADRAGVSLFTVQRIERGEGSVRPKTGRAIAGALDVGVEDLLGKAQRLPPLDGWLASHGARWALLTDDEFKERVLAEARDDAGEERERVQGLIDEIVREEAEMLSTLMHEFLHGSDSFPWPAEPGPGKIGRALRRGEDVDRFKEELRRPYSPLILGLVNYGRALDVEKSREERLAEAMAG